MEQGTEKRAETSTDDTKALPSAGSDTAQLMGILSYIGPLVVIPYVTAKGDSFVRFHTRQGLVLFFGELLLWVASWMIWVLFPIISLLQLGMLILSIIGIVNVVNKKETPLPLVGGFAEHITI